MSKRTVLFFLLAVGLLQGCIVVQDKYDKIAPGVWRGVIQIIPTNVALNKDAKPAYRDLIQFEEVTSGEAPFLMDVSYTETGDLRMVIENGDSLVVPKIYYGLNRATALDTIVMQFNDSSKVTAQTQEGIIEGDWIAGDHIIHFVAKHGKDYRFTSLKKKPAHNIAGNYKLSFIKDNYSKDIPEQVTLEILHNDLENDLTGYITFQGKRKQLKGTIQRNKFYLSRFDGEDAILVEGKIFDNNSISGILQVNKSVDILWSALK